MGLLSATLLWAHLGVFGLGRRFVSRRPVHKARGWAKGVVTRAGRVGLSIQAQPRQPAAQLRRWAIASGRAAAAATAAAALLTCSGGIWSVQADIADVLVLRGQLSVCVQI